MELSSTIDYPLLNALVEVVQATFVVSAISAIIKTIIKKII